MSHSLKIRAAGVLLAAASFAAQAADAPAAPNPAPAPAAEGQVVVRDAETGELRAPTSGEFQALHANAAQARTAMRPLARKAHASGAQGVRLTDEFMSYAVMVRQPDGRLVEYCFPDAASAEAAIGSATLLANQLPTE